MIVMDFMGKVVNVWLEMRAPDGALVVSSWWFLAAAKWLGKDKTLMTYLFQPFLPSLPSLPSPSFVIFSQISFIDVFLCKKKGITP